MKLGIESTKGEKLMAGLLLLVVLIALMYLILELCSLSWFGDDYDEPPDEKEGSE
jgi:hypothetical protein